ncbi:MAG: DUF1844 domain-containing protein [Acidobacteriota bacterium]
MSEDHREGKVKVVDRRWLTPEGEPKEPIPPIVDHPAPTHASPPPEPAPSDPIPAKAEAVSGGDAVRLPQRAFLDLVDMLSQYAMALLSGQVPGLDRDPAAARLFIDLLAEVQSRTQGTLSPQEAKVLDDVLFQLRSYYIAPR